MATNAWLVGLTRETVTATNGMLVLAAAGNGHGIDAQSVAQKAGAELGELGGVFRRLQAAGLVEPDGNGSVAFRMTREPAEVSLYEVAEAVGEPFDVCSCLRSSGSDLDDCPPCPLEAVSRQLRADVITMFKTRTLGDYVTAMA